MMGRRFMEILGHPACKSMALIGFAIGALGAAASPAGGQERVTVVTEAGTPMVAIEVLLAVGPLDEEPEQAGITYVAARSLIEPLRSALNGIGAYVSLHSYKDAIGFSLLAAPDAWEEASRTLLVALFRDPVDSVAVEREKRAVQTELEGRAANPADALSREVDRAFWGEDHPWGRPAVGSVQTVRLLRLRDVDAFLREHFLPSRTYVSVVGPVEAETARAHLGPHLGSSAGDRHAPFRPGAPADVRLNREYNSITTWIAASYRFGEGADLEALRLLTHLAAEGVSFGPRRPTVYNARGEIFAYPGEGEIRFEVVVPPGEAEEWAERLEREVAQFARNPLSTNDFEQHLRSYRGRRLMELRSPDARAREAARRLFLFGATVAFDEFDRLTPERLHQAASSIESPIVLLLGPTPPPVD
jgi:predicted Zn-dependent peptidase